MKKKSAIRRRKRKERERRERAKSNARDPNIQSYFYWTGTKDSDKQGAVTLDQLIATWHDIRDRKGK